jgi:hypothetical protein
MASKIFPSLQLTGGTDCAPGLTPDLFVYGGAKIKKNLCAGNLTVKNDVTTKNINVTGTLMVNGQPITPSAPQTIPPYITTGVNTPVVLTAQQTVGLTFVYTNTASQSVTLQFPASNQLTALLGDVQHQRFDVWCTSLYISNPIVYDFFTQGGGYSVFNTPPFPNGNGQNTQILRFVQTTAPPMFPNFSVFVQGQ